jgi:riboflavin biosynthesis pyrimidine reductase
VRRIHPDPAADLSDADIAAAYEFPERRPWVRGSMISTLDGAMRGRDGTSRSISTAADRRVFSTLRLTADVIMVGAGTVRDEQYSPSRMPIAIVTSRLDLPPSLPVLSGRTESSSPVIVITTARAASGASTDLRAIAEVIACGDEHVDLAAGIDYLHGRGLGRIHCEGGPRLLGSLAEAGLLDEMLLTLTPTLLGSSPEERVLAAPAGLVPTQRLHLTQVLEDEGSLFVRARRP